MIDIKLFVDDQREAPEGWHLVRTITEAVRLLESGVVSVLSLDHDVALNSFSDGFCDETYATVARYVAAMPEKMRPYRVYIHTANPKGAALMGTILEGKVKEIVHISQYSPILYTQQIEEYERNHP